VTSTQHDISRYVMTLDIRLTSSVIDPNIFSENSAYYHNVTNICRQ